MWRNPDALPINQQSEAGAASGGPDLTCQVFEEKREWPEPVGPDRAIRLVSVSIRLASVRPVWQGTAQLAAFARIVIVAPCDHLE